MAKTKLLRYCFCKASKIPYSYESNQYAEQIWIRWTYQVVQNPIGLICVTARHCLRENELSKCFYERSYSSTIILNPPRFFFFSVAGDDSVDWDDCDIESSLVVKWPEDEVSRWYNKIWQKTLLSMKLSCGKRSLMNVIQPKPALSSVCTAARLCVDDIAFVPVRFACACILVDRDWPQGLEPKVIRYA